MSRATRSTSKAPRCCEVFLNGPRLPSLVGQRAGSGDGARLPLLILSGRVTAQDTPFRNLHSRYTSDILNTNDLSPGNVRSSAGAASALLGVHSGGSSSAKRRPDFRQATGDLNHRRSIVIDRMPAPGISCEVDVCNPKRPRPRRGRNAASHRDRSPTLQVHNFAR